MSGNAPKVLALSGGVGGAKLALGLYESLAPGALTILANTGDDFVHLGLHISPDIDTVTYTLAGLANPETGWGRTKETWSFMAALRTLGGEAWFNLGDGDLALHIERTRRLSAGETLSAVTADLCGKLGITATILPMSDAPVPTIVHTDRGDLPFQHYFVRERCLPRVTGFMFVDADRAVPPPAIEALARDPALAAIVICPSNPYISIDPILAVPGMRRMIESATAPVIAVSPIVGGRALKGPTAKMMAELGITPTSAAIAAHYRGLIDAIVLDAADGDAAFTIMETGVRVMVANTVMTTLDDKQKLAESVLELARLLRTGKDAP